MEVRHNLAYLRFQVAFGNEGNTHAVCLCDCGGLMGSTACLVTGKFERGDWFNLQEKPMMYKQWLIFALALMFLFPLGTVVSADKEKQADNKVEKYNEIEITCKNILGHRACLYSIEDNGQFYLKVTYRGKSAKVKLEKGEVSFELFDVTFKLTLSDIKREGDILSFHIKLVAETPFGDIPIINDTVKINLKKLKASDERDLFADKIPIIAFEPPPQKK
jgi:hypothetical protein